MAEFKKFLLMSLIQLNIIIIIVIVYSVYLVLRNLRQFSLYLWYSSDFSKSNAKCPLEIKSRDFVLGGCPFEISCGLKTCVGDSAVTAVSRPRQFIRIDLRLTVTWEPTH